MNSLRLRNQPLTAKPRVVRSYGKTYWVEKKSPLGPLVVLKDSFTEAIELANEWAVNKEETPC